MTTTITVDRTPAGDYAFAIREGQSLIANGCRFQTRMTATQRATEIAISRCEGAPGRATNAEIRLRKRIAMTRAQEQSA